MTALVALACSLGVGAVLWRIWRGPRPAAPVVYADGRRARWVGLGLTWELLAEDGEFRELVIRPLRPAGEESGP